jgi:hypothetical protein
VVLELFKMALPHLVTHRAWRVFLQPVVVAVLLNM